MDDTSALVPGAHRAIRRLDAHESAFVGELVTDGERMRVRVADADVAEPLWIFASAEHVAGVRDVIRHRNGLDVLLPWCTDPLDVFLGRRGAAESPLSAGEVVTLVGSLLRGIAEVDDYDLRGRWWLTDDARPVFVPGEGAACVVASGEIIARVRETCTDRVLERKLTEIGTAAADRRAVLRSIDRWEHEFAEHAAPRALEREVYSAQRVSTIALHHARLPQDVDHLAEQGGLRQVLGERLVAIVERVREWMRRRSQHPKRQPRTVDHDAPRSRAGRGRILLVGAAAAGVVLLGGLLWPTGSDESSATESIVTETPAAKPEESAATAQKRETQTADDETDAPVKKPKPEADPIPDAELPPEADADRSVQQSAAWLLQEISKCAARDDIRCDNAVVEGAGKVVLQKLGENAVEREITPIEDYGDVAVIRLGPAGEDGEQMLVLIRHKDGWLVRDVYDVADQPSG